MNDLRTTLRVAILYYEEGLTHEEIARSLRVSRQTVGRLLKGARESGVVQIRIQHPPTVALELERQVATAYGLREAVIIPAERFLDAQNLKDALGAATAEYLARTARDGDTIGISWGTTMARVGGHLGRYNTSHVRVVQLNGGLSQGPQLTNAYALLEQFGKAFHAEVYGLGAPAIVDSPAICQAICQDSRVARGLEIAREANIAVYSIGVVGEQSALVAAGYIGPQLMQCLSERGAVGDICSRYINSRGDVADPHLDERTIAISLENLRQKDLSVAVAGGVHKEAAIRAALAGKYANVLITDEITARALLSAQSVEPTTSPTI